MSKLTKAQAQRHREAEDLLAGTDPLTDDDVEFVLTHWQETANVSSPLESAYFTPPGLALDLAIDVCGSRVIDLCAGIGTLAWAVHSRYGSSWDRSLPPLHLVCVEKSPLYVEVGRRLLPQAEWVCADVFDLPDLAHRLGLFDTAIANPPWGPTTLRGRRGPRYRGTRMEYHVIDLAAELANHGTFLIPQTSAPFTYSGTDHFSSTRPEHYLEFKAQTGIRLDHGVGVDTTHRGYGTWHHFVPTAEIVTCDYTERERATSTPRAATAKPSRRQALSDDKPVAETLF